MYTQYDVSLPLSVLYELVEITRARCKDMAKCTVGYGHIGDGMLHCGWCSDPVLVCVAGNLHLNLVGETHSTELLNLIEPFVFDWTGTLGQMIKL